MTIVINDHSLRIKDNAAHSPAISLFWFCMGCAWGYFSWSKFGFIPFIAIGAPVVLILFAIAAVPFFSNRCVEFDRKSRTIRSVRELFCRERIADFRFADYSRIVIQERIAETPRRSVTYLTYLVRCDQADESVPRTLVLGTAFDEANAWSVVDAVCETTDIPKPRSIKPQGTQRSGPR